jgi:HD-GYP domain-containing protein (c-di-GMP phosphodiesterase class II)
VSGDSTNSSISILYLGGQSSAYFELKKQLGATPFVVQKYDMDEILQRREPEPAVVVCSEPPPNISLMEVAQAIRMTYPTCTIYYLSNLRNEFNRKNLCKNGFTDAFLLPGDSSLFGDALKSELSKASKGRIRHYRSVKLLDISAGTKLDFDVHVHLPLNNKYIKFSKAGETIDDLRLQRLEKKEKNSVFVASEQMSAFYQYAANQLKSLSDDNLSETEKQEKRQNMVRELMSGMFAENVSGEVDTFSQGKEILKDCQEVIKSYVLGSDDGKNNWYKTIVMTSGGKSSAYSHAVNTSTYAALFSIALGVGKPEELALAGLLHDLGLTLIPYEIQIKPENLRTSEEQATYLSHAVK